MCWLILFNINTTCTINIWDSMQEETCFYLDPDEMLPIMPSGLAMIIKTEDNNYSPYHARFFMFYTIGVASIMQYMYMHNKNSNTQGSSPNVVKVIFHTTRNCS